MQLRGSYTHIFFSQLLVLAVKYCANITVCLKHIWDKVYKIRPSKICGKQALKSLK